MLLRALRRRRVDFSVYARLNGSAVVRWRVECAAVSCTHRHKSNTQQQFDAAAAAFALDCCGWDWGYYDDDLRACKVFAA